MKKRAVAAILLAAVALNACTPAEEGRGSVSNTEEKNTEVPVVDLGGNAEVTPTEAETPEPTQEVTEPTVYTGEMRTLQIEAEVVFDGWSNDNYNYSAHIEAPEIKLEEESFPDLAKALGDYGRSLQDTAKNTDLPEMIDICKEMETSVPEPEENVYLVSEYSTGVVRADTVITSLLTTRYADYHGAHPSTVYMTKNFDSISGQELDIYDVINEDQMDGLPELIADTLLGEYPEVDFYEPENLTGTVDDLLGMNSDLTFTLDYSGITFYFSAYDLAPYAYGPQFVTFRYEDYPDLVKTEYQQAPDNYIYPLNSYGSNILPDGRELELHIFAFGEEYAEGYTIDTALEGNKASYEIYDAFDVTPWLVHFNDNDYMYVEWSTFNDYGMISVFDLNGSKVETPQEFPGSLPGSPTNPENMKIRRRGDLLSTVGTFCYYSVGNDGMPVALTDYEFINSEVELTLKQDLTCECRSDFDAPEDAAEETLAKGTRIRFYAQNEKEGWVDCVLPDGRYVRIYVDCSDYPRTVDGKDIELLFDGLFWAG